ncbi:MAG TPA: rod shape-determining protein MreD [Actinomycetota bacterium]
MFSAIMLAAVLLQTTVLPQLTLFGAAPDLVLLVTISMGLLEGPVAGAAVGAAGGLLEDLLLTAITGLTALTYLLVGYAVGKIRPYTQSTSVLVPVTGIFVGTVAAQLTYAALSVLLGGPPSAMDRVLQTSMLGGLYNAIIAPFVYPVVRQAASFRTEKTARW